MNQTKSQFNLQTVSYPFLALAAATAFFYFASPVVIPLVIALSLAYVLAPLVSLLKRFKIPHIIAVFIVVVFALVVLFWVAYFLFAQANSFLNDFPKYYNGLSNLLSDLKQELISRGILSPTEENLNIEFLELKNFSGVTNYMIKGISSIFTFFFGGILVAFLTFFILADQEVIKSKLIRAFGKKKKQVTENILIEINQQIKGFIVIKFSITIVLSAIYTVGFLIIGVNYAYIWGPLAGILNLVPYIGPIVGLFPPLIVAAIQFKSFMPVLWVVILYEVVQIIEGNFVTPRLVGERVNLSPLAVIVAAMYWTWLWGAIGIILAIPITATIKVICDHIDSLKPIGILIGGKREVQEIE
ncbi:MAG: hypothetical protein AMJ90_08480 [candidate division Zixibacteria bacterium SM23_73_2]|nr:MAG: hypothetical protein AMJ90_08480 [candidate division Zixibacteria bacterium SM23_73_2]